MVWLDKYCRDHPDESVLFGGPSLQALSPGTKQYRIAEVPLICHSENGECVRASIAYAVGASGYKDSAEAVWMKGKICVNSLGEAPNWLEASSGRLKLCMV